MARPLQHLVDHPQAYADAVGNAYQDQQAVVLVDVRRRLLVDDEDLASGLLLHRGEVGAALAEEATDLRSEVNNFEK